MSNPEMWSRTASDNALVCEVLIFSAGPVMGRSDHQGQTIRLPVRRASQQNGVQHAENGGVDTDADGERGDHDQANPGLLRSCRRAKRRSFQSAISAH